MATMVVRCVTHLKVLNFIEQDINHGVHRGEKHKGHKDIFVFFG